MSRLLVLLLLAAAPVLSPSASVAQTAASLRPQQPTRPFPYREEEVSYLNPRAPGVTLAGTLTIPPGKGPFPAVLLITGSGPQDRNETLFGHQPFFILADDLTRRGIEVLRVDDRGTEKSTGTFSGATTLDFAGDAEAGLAFLDTRPEVDHRRTGLIGHSEGAIIAPMIAAKDRHVAFIVMLAGSGVNGSQIVAEQGRLIEINGGVKPEIAAEHARQALKLHALLISEKDDAVLRKRLQDEIAADATAAGHPPSKADNFVIIAAANQLMSPWFRFFLAYDPVPALRQVTCPVLVLNGSKDMQVSPAQNLPPIRAALAHNHHAEIDELPNLNHLFQTASTGDSSEYGTIPETFAPAALNKISTWILTQPRLQ